jgi:hypothetical protein
MRVGERKNPHTCPGVEPPFLVGVEIIDKIIRCLRKYLTPTFDN